MMINPNVNLTGGVTHSDMVRNAQHAGFQKDAVTKTASEETTPQASDSVVLSSPQQTQENKQTGEAQTSGTAGESKESKETAGQGKTDEAKDNASAKPNDGTSASPGGAAGIDFETGMPGSDIGSDTSASSGTTEGSDCGSAPAAGETETPSQPSTPAAGSGDGSGTETAGSDTSVDPAAELKKLQEMQAQQQQIQTIWMEMMAERQKHFAAMFKLMMETQNAIYETMQAVCQARSVTMDNVMRGWSSVITGGR